MAERSPPGAVLFDLDGVLIDSYDVWFELMNAAARAFGTPAISPEAFRASWGQGVEADRERFFPERSVEEIAAFYDAHFADHLEHLRVDPAVGPVFEELARRGLPTAVVTNTPNPLATRIVARTEATPDVVVGGTDVEHAKPAPDMVRLACQRVGVLPEAAVVVGDSAYDRDAARAAGAAFAGLGIGGDWSIDRLGELPAALFEPSPKT